MALNDWRAMTAKQRDDAVDQPVDNGVLRPQIMQLWPRVVLCPGLARLLDRLFYTAGVANSFGIRSFLEQRQFARPERISDEIVEAYLESATQPNAEYAALSFVRGDLCFDLSEYITQLTVPTVIFWGEKSQFTGPEIGRRLAEMNPTIVQFHQLTDVGLTPQLEIPAVIIGLIQKFLPPLEPTE